MAHNSFYVASLSLVLMAASMPLMTHAQSEYTPFSEPGVIMPGMSVRFLITSLGEVWSQPRLIDSIAHLCTDVLPTLADTMPEQFSPVLWESSCELVNEVVNDIDTGKLCEGLNSTFANLTGILEGVMAQAQANMPGAAAGSRRRRDITQADIGRLVDPDFARAAIFNITADIYGFDAENATPTTVCKAAAEKILIPSIPKQIAEFGSRVGAVYMPLGQFYLCDQWDMFVNGLAAESNATTPAFVNDLADAVANGVGFKGRMELCSKMNAATAAGKSAMKKLSRTIIINAFKVITDGNHCSTTASSIIDVITPVNPQIALIVSDANIYQFTGYKSIGAMCGQVGSSFSAYSAASHVTSQLGLTILTIISILSAVSAY